MGIKFNCPNGHKLNVKSFLAGRRGICPQCDARFRIPLESGGVAEPIVKGDRAEATPLTAAMQDDAYAAREQAAGGAMIASQPEFGSPLGSYVAGAPLNPSLHSNAPAFASSLSTSPLAASPFRGDAMAAADPLSESPQAVWYVRPRSGGQYGPAVGEILREWIAEGRVAGDSLVWREGWPDWRQASSVFPQLAGLVSGAMLPAGVGIPQASVSIAAAGPVAAFGQLACTSPVAAVGTPLGGVAAGPEIGTSAGIGTLDTVVPTGPATPKAHVRRKSGNFTALIVILLIFVAIVMMAIFAWVLTSQPESPAALRTASLVLTPLARAWQPVEKVEVRLHLRRDASIPRENRKAGYLCPSPSWAYSTGG